jgi:hypothetical protein
MAVVVDKALADAIAASSKLATVGLQGVNYALKEMQGVLGPVSIGFDAATAALMTLNAAVEKLPIVGGLLAPLTEALAVAPTILKDITNSLVSMAEKASPAQFYLWQRALDDTQAVIGHSFLPIMELMRESVRLVGDTLANFLPSSAEVRTALGELRAVFAEMGKEVRAALATAGPAIRGALIEALRTVAHWAAVAARAIGILAEELRSTFGAVGDASSAAATARSSMGMAAAPARISGIADYQRQLQLEAFRQPGTSREDQALAAAQLSAGELTKIDEQARELINTVKGAYDWSRDAIGKIGEVLAQVPSILHGIWDTLREWYNKAFGASEVGVPRGLQIEGAEKFAVWAQSVLGLESPGSVYSAYTAAQRAGAAYDARRNPRFAYGPGGGFTPPPGR